MSPYKDFLFVGSDTAKAATLRVACEIGGWESDFAASSEAALGAFDTNRFRAVFVDLDDAGLRGLQILEWLRSRGAFTRFGALTLRPERPEWLRALELGAVSLLDGISLASPETLREDLNDILRRYDSFRDGCVYSRSGDVAGGGFDWIGAVPAVRYVLEKSRREAMHLGPALIRGESGSGLKQLARIMSAEFDAAWVGWFDASQVEVSDQCGAFEKLLAQAPEQGRKALCLPEVSHLHPEIQSRIVKDLRRRFKVIATSSADLDLAVRGGRFRDDLRWLLESCFFLVPDLRERKEDIPVLASWFLDESFFSERVRYFSNDALTALQAYDWPGNVRELRDTVETSASRAEGAMIRAKDLPSSILAKSFYVQQAGEEILAELSYNDAKKLALNKFNKEYIFELLSRSSHNLAVAAEKAGMDRSNFKKIIRKYFPED